MYGTLAIIVKLFGESKNLMKNNNCENWKQKESKRLPGQLYITKSNRLSQSGRIRTNQTRPVPGKAFNETCIHWYPNVFL